MNEFKHCDKQF